MSTMFIKATVVYFRRSLFCLKHKNCTTVLFLLNTSKSFTWFNSDWRSLVLCWLASYDCSIDWYISCKVSEAADVTYCCRVWCINSISRVAWSIPPIPKRSTWRKLSRQSLAIFSNNVEIARYTSCFVTLLTCECTMTRVKSASYTYGCTSTQKILENLCLERCNNEIYRKVLEYCTSRLLQEGCLDVRYLESGLIYAWCNHWKGFCPADQLHR